MGLGIMGKLNWTAVNILSLPIVDNISRKI